jgi:hypothetical protein
LYPPGFQWYWKADFVNHVSDEAIARHLRHGSELPSMFSSMHLHPINGAARKVAASDTAFSYQDTKWAEVIIGVDPEPANKRPDRRVGQEPLGGGTPIMRICGRWRIHEFYDGGRRSTRSSDLWAELRESTAGQKEIRPD